MAERMVDLSGSRVCFWGSARASVLAACMTRAEIMARMDRINNDPVLQGHWSAGSGKGNWEMDDRSEAAAKRRDALHDEYRRLVELRRTLSR